MLQIIRFNQTLPTYNQDYHVLLKSIHLNTKLSLCIQHYPLRTSVIPTASSTIPIVSIFTTVHQLLPQYITQYSVLIKCEPLCSLVLCAQCGHVQRTCPAKMEQMWQSILNFLVGYPKFDGFLNVIFGERICLVSCFTRVFLVLSMSEEKLQVFNAKYL